MLGKDACPDDDRLLAFVEERLGPDERASVVAHVEGCDDCRRLAGLLVASAETGDAPPGPPADAVADAPADSLLGQSLLGYRVRRELGRGGMGVVYEAEQEDFGQRAAIKIVSPEVASDAEAVARLFAEARAASAVDHPGVVKMYNAGRLPSGEPFLIMEFVEGEPLQRHLEGLRKQKRRLPLAAALQLGADIAATLAAVHEGGVVHRDLKPANVMVSARDDGFSRVRVVDFGLAKMPEAPTVTGLTTTHRFVGTVVYASPEQCAGLPELGPPSDVYSLGVLLYELIAGKPPFAGLPLVVLGLHQREAPPPLPAAAPDCPAAVCSLVHAMLAKAPARRPTMARVAMQLRAMTQALRSGSLVPDAGDTAPASPAAVSTGALSSPAQGGGPAARTGPAIDAPPLRGRRPLVALAVFGALGAGALAVLLTRPDAAPPRGPAALGSVDTVRSERRPAPQPPRPEAVDLAEARVRALEVITDGLQDSRPPQRQQALHALTRYPDEMTRLIAEPMLRDPDWPVQAAAAEALGTLRSEAARRALTARWDGRDRTIAPRVALAIGHALREIAPKEAAARLRRLLYPSNFVVEDAAVARHAVVQLALAGDTAMGRLLRGAVEALPLEERVPVLGDLARGGDQPAQQALRALLPAEPSEALHLRVADALMSCRSEPALALLRRTAGREGPLQLLSARLLAEHEESPGPALFLQRLASGPLEERVLSAEALGAARRRDVAPALLSLLSAQEPLRLRLSAAESLLILAREDPEQRTLDTLLWIQRTLSDPRWLVRLQAVGPLGDADPRLALPPLQRALRDESPEVRRVAARSLGRTRARAAVPPLRGALGDREAPVRQEAALALGAIGRDLREGGEPVDDLRQDVAKHREQGDSSERLSYAAALADLGDAAGRDRLLAALRDPSPDLRYAAAAYLAERGRNEGVAELRVAAAGRGGRALLAASLLARLGAARPGPLEVALGAPEPSLRAAAVVEIGRLPAKDALPLLSRAVGDADPQVRRALVVALGSALAKEAAARPLLRALAVDPDPQVRGHAGAVLGRLAPARPGSAEESAQAAAAAHLGGDRRRARELSAGRDDALSLRTAGELACEDRDAAAARAAYGALRDGASRRHVAALCRRAGLELGPPPRTPQALAALEARIQPEDRSDLAPTSAAEVAPGLDPGAAQAPAPPAPATRKTPTGPGSTATPAGDRAPPSQSPLLTLPKDINEVLKK